MADYFPETGSRKGAGGYLACWREWDGAAWRYVLGKDGRALVFPSRQAAIDAARDLLKRRLNRVRADRVFEREAEAIRAVFGSAAAIGGPTK